MSLDDTKITYVTALYDLGRDKLSQGFSRSMDQYLESFKKLLEKDINLVVFCDDGVEKVVWEHREKHNTQVINKPLESSFKEKIEQIRKDSKWYSQAGWLEESPQAKLEWYNPLVMNKQFYLNDSAIWNHFDSDYFFWIDAGISNTVHLGYFDEPHFEKRLIRKVLNNRMLYLAFPYDGQNEVHGFKKSGMNKYAGTDTKYVCRGGFFGGSKTAIERVNGVYYHTLENTLSKGYMGTEESVFTIISYTHKDLFNVEMIESNGLIYKFFEDLKNIEISDSEDVALYFLTFNAPEQIEKQFEIFDKTFKRFFGESKKYLINNSTDSKHDSAYSKLCEKYNVEQFKFDNIGITGGRRYAAEHFDSSKHRYMIFFEDDMIMNEKDGLCKAGFKKKEEDLFNKAVTILEENELDYLKLTFSEFFGDNFKNWTWHNIHGKDRQDYLDNDEVDADKTRMFYGGSYRGLPYMVGEFFYCNWPVLFSKEGSRKVFMGHKISHEAGLMSNTQKEIRKGNVKAGCLLASPITHHRFVHYPASARKEG